MTDPTRREDYDSPWKTLLEHYFQAFLEWFFPTVAADVGWVRGFEFLDKELQKVTRQAATGRRYADKLVKGLAPERRGNLGAGASGIAGGAGSGVSGRHPAVGGGNEDAIRDQRGADRDSQGDRTGPARGQARVAGAIARGAVWAIAGMGGGEGGAAEPARLEGWARRVLTAESLEAVFAEAK